MKIRMNGRMKLMIVLVLLMGFSAGCGSGGDELSLQDIPRYPNATEGESMAKSSPGGMVGGKLVQFSTTDSFDDVVDFYTDALNKYDPQIMSHTSGLGRQTAISISQKKGMISIAIQELSSEGKVNITFMAVGS